MPAPSIVPTLDELEHALDVFRSRLVRAPYIDNFQRMVAEEETCKREIARIEAEIVARYGTAIDDYPGTPAKTFNCPRWPGCGCPDGTFHLDCPALTRAPA